MGDTTLVTGATGFLGGALVRCLQAMGLPVIAQGRDPARLAALRAKGIATLALDLTQPIPRATLDALRDVSTILHCAARSAPHGPARAFTLANVTATAHLLDTAQTLGVSRFLFVSSSSVSFAPTDQLDVAESDPLPPPFNAYAASKQQAEALVLDRFPAATILRPRGIYGAGDTALLPRLLRAARRGPLPVLRDRQGRIDLTHVDDVVDATLAALQAVGSQVMLTDGIAGAYARGRDQIAGTTGVQSLLTQVCDRRNALPQLFQVRGADWLDNHALAEEVFGPLGLIVTVSGEDEMLAIARSLQGQLTCTIHLDDGDKPAARKLLPILERKAGRVLVNGYPTGVEVCDAMVHGGPYPASTNFGATSVGTLSIRRFLRPVSFQNLPQDLLPQDLR